MSVVREQAADLVATSSVQDGLWFADRLAPGSPAANLVRAYRVTGPLDIGALRAAWREVVHRHQALRTTLVEVGGRPRQRIAQAGPDTPHGFSVVDLSGAASSFGRWCAEGAGTGFRLDTGPLVRLAVARLAPHDHGILLVVHRVTADERAVSVVVEDLAAAYESIVEHRPWPGTGQRQYADYARWRPEVGAGAAAHLATLAGVPAHVDLPADRARPAGPCWLAAVARFDWGTGAAHALRQFASAAGTSAPVVVLAAFLTLLHRHAGAGPVSAGVPATVLPGPAFDRVVGACTNPVVVGVDLSDTPTFGNAVGRTAAALAAAMAHRDIPLAEVVRQLNPARDPRRIPFCDAVFVAREEPSRLSLSPAEVRPWPVDNGATDTDLVLSLDPVGAGIGGDLRYRTALFDASTARQLLEQLRVLLASALAEPGCPIDRLPLETVAVTRAALRASDRIAAAGRIDRTVHERVRLQARDCPAAVAVEDGGGAVSYEDLDRTATLVASALRAGGAVDGQPVAVRMPTGAPQIASVLAVFRAGAHLVSFDAGDRGERCRAVLSDLRPARLLVAGAAVDDEVTRWYHQEYGGQVIEVDGLTRDPAAGEPVGEPAGDPVADLDATAYIAHTSGSTGRPKGIPQTHRALAQFAAWFAGAFGIRPGSRVAQWAASSYDASLCEIFAALTAGATLCVVPDRIRVNPERMADWLVSRRITLFQTVPSFARELLAALNIRGTAGGLVALDHLLLAGEVLPGELAAGLRAALPNTRLINLYGTTESILSTWYEVTEGGAGPTPIGAPIPGRQVLILDEFDQPCPAGVTGQIVVHSPYVTAGYVGGAGDEVFRPVPHGDQFSVNSGRWHRTGDLGRRRWDGQLEYRGRRDQQIKFNGMRLELDEIEAVLAVQPAVTDCAVVGVTGPHGRIARLVAYVVVPPADAGDLTLVDAWRSAVGRHLGAMKLPILFRIVESLPRNAGGKVDRRKLAAPGTPDGGPARSLRPPVEPGLAAIWAELLGGAYHDRQQTFTAAGGHSLLVPVLLSRIRERYGVDVPIWTYYADPTLAGLAAAVQARRAPAARATVTVSLPDPA